MRVEISKEEKKELNTLFFALVSGVIMIIVILTFVLRWPLNNFIIDFDFITGIGLGIAILAPFIGSYLFQHFMKDLPQAGDRDEQVQILKKSYVTRWAFIEGAALINAILFGMLEKNVCLIAAVLLAVVLLLNRPVFD